MRKLLPIVAILLLSSSCGIVRMRSSEAYLPGPAIRADYTPQGIVEEHYHPCSVKGPTQRHLIAYLPADYYESTQRYPVLYLLHGARGYETSWIRKGKVYQTCDSLWREGKAAPCIVIMPNVNSYIDDYDYEGGRFKDAFESIFEVDGYVESAFMRDVVHFVDSVYRTVPDGAHRAVAGLYSVCGQFPAGVWLCGCHVPLYVGPGPSQHYPLQILRRAGKQNEKTV